MPRVPDNEKRAKHSEIIPIAEWRQFILAHLPNPTAVLAVIRAKLEKILNGEEPIEKRPRVLKEPLILILYYLHGTLLLDFHTCRRKANGSELILGSLDDVVSVQIFNELLTFPQYVSRSGLVNQHFDSLAFTARYAPVHGFLQGVVHNKQHTAAHFFLDSGEWAMFGCMEYDAVTGDRIAEFHGGNGYGSGHIELSFEITGDRGIVMFSPEGRQSFKWNYEHKGSGIWARTAARDIRTVDQLSH